MDTELQELKAQLDDTRAELRRAARRARLSGACALAAPALTLLVNVRPAALAQSPGVTLASLVARTAKLEAKTAPLNLSSDPNAGGTNTLLTITGVNVQIVNGPGGTETQNGLGNLIVGYNESDGFKPATAATTSSPGCTTATRQRRASSSAMPTPSVNGKPSPWATATPPAASTPP